MTLKEYINDLIGKKLAVVGIGVSNTPLIRLLAQSGADVTAHDKRSEAALGEVYDELKGLGVKFCLGEGYLDSLNYDVIFRTPGLHPQALEAGKSAGAVITSEMEAFFAVCPCRIIAVTGSDGKTTTTTLISELLKAGGRTVHLGGNIGQPLLCEADSFGKDDICVLELSSFQLHSMTCRPDVAVITNLSPNHLDVHPSFEDYVQAKKSIYLRQEKGDRLVLNLDNALTAACADDAKADVSWFSMKKRVENGYYRADGAIYRQNEKIIDTADILLPGEHNVENLMAALAATEGMVSDDTKRRVAETFGGVVHRLELIRTLRGVRYYNDSIGTSPTRTVAGLRSFDKKVILIAGGHDKHVPLDELCNQILKSVKALFVTGETAELLKGSVEKTAGYDAEKLPIFLIDDFEETVRSAAQYSAEGDIVLLSPAFSSFDKFKNYVERGNTFRKVVEELS